MATLNTMMGVMTAQQSGSCGSGRPASIVLPPTVSDAKRMDFLRVQMIKGLFEEAHFLAAWRAADSDVSGMVLSYNMDYARERARTVLATISRQRSREPAKDFLRNAILLLWNTGAEGLFLDHFLEDKGKISSWPRFMMAFMAMRRFYHDFAGARLSSALDGLFVILTDITTRYPSVSLATIVFLAQEKLGGLRLVGPVLEKAPSCVYLMTQVLEVSRLEITELLQIEAFGRRPLAEADDEPAAKRARASGGSGGGSGGGGGGGGGAGQTVPFVRAPLSEAPPLAGDCPCFRWILGKASCKGKEQCPTAKKFPHAFGAADKGAPEKAFRAWVHANRS